jgi:hypothetical protein
MTTELAGNLILGGATILAALIGVAGLLLQPYFTSKWAQRSQPIIPPAPEQPPPELPAKVQSPHEQATQAKPPQEPLPQEPLPQEPPSHTSAIQELSPARIATRQATAATLLAAATKLRQSVTNLENLHDNRASRLVAFWSALRGRDLSREAESEFREVGPRLALEPSARLHKALDTFADAEQAYFDALMRPFREPANLRRFYFYMTPKSELTPLSAAAEASWQKLERAVGAYRTVGEWTQATH